jgi:hypothetical protein
MELSPRGIERQNSQDLGVGAIEPSSVKPGHARSFGEPE